MHGVRKAPHSQTIYLLRSLGSFLLLAVLIGCDLVTPKIPELVNPGEQFNQLGDTVEIHIEARNAGTSASYQAQDLPTGLEIVASTGVIVGELLEAGTYTVRLELRSSQQRVSTEFSWHVNTAPQLEAITDQESFLGDEIKLQLLAQDADGDDLSFSANGLPEGLELDPDRGFISGVLTQAGLYEVQVQVVDTHRASVETSFLWTVTQPNTAPVLGPILNQLHSVGDTVELQLEASDTDGDALVFSAEGLPEGLSLVAETGLIAGTLLVAGLYDVSVSVEDSGNAKDSKTFTWEVVPANQPPSLINPGAQRHRVGEAVSLQLSASDPDGDSLSFGSSNLPPGLSLDTQSGKISGQPSSVGDYLVTVSVSDGRGGSDSTSFNWEILAAITPETSLVAWWTFDEGSGSLAQDASGNGNTATIRNGAWGPGRVGTALYMDGGDDSIVEVPLSASLRGTAEQITVMAWAYRTAEHNSAILAQTYPRLFFGFHAPRQFKWGLTNRSGRLAECYADRRHVAALNTWYHMAGSYDGTTLRLYVNGEEICTIGLAGPRSMPEAPLTMSGYLDDSGGIVDEITGRIDDVRIYNRALSASEIRAIYEQFD